MDDNKKTLSKLYAIEEKVREMEGEKANLERAERLERQLKSEIDALKTEHLKIIT